MNNTQRTKRLRDCVMGHLERRNQIASRNSAVRKTEALAAALETELALFSEAQGIAQVRTQ